MTLVAVVGGSLAGLTAVDSMRQAGFKGEIVLVSHEDQPIVDRPALSKGYITGQQSLEDVLLPTARDLDDLHVSVCVADPAVRLDIDSRCLSMRSGEELGWDRLVIATGARPVWPEPWPRLEGTYVLRTLEDAERLRQQMESSSAIVIVGAGFIGLEIASSARQLGLEVTSSSSSPILSHMLLALPSVVPSQEFIGTAACAC